MIWVVVVLLVVLIIIALAAWFDSTRLLEHVSRQVAAVALMLNDANLERDIDTRAVQRGVDEIKRTLKPYD